MKKTCLIMMLLAIGISVQAQNSNKTARDSAEAIVNHYLKLLNHDSIPQDTMLYIESYIYSRSNPSDTTVMKRWYWAPYCSRTEVWHGDTLTAGLRTNSYDSYMKYIPEKKRWYKSDVAEYYTLSRGYDFRGLLYFWRIDQSSLQYKGVWNYNGHEVYRVLVTNERQFARNYLFEKESGLLFMIDETEDFPESLTIKRPEHHTDWRAIHEYISMDNMLFPSIESYQVENEIVLIFHKYSYQPIRKELFIND